MKLRRLTRLVGLAVGALVILTVTALWAHGQLTGSPLGTLWQTVVVVLVIASGYRVYGRRTMTNAVDDAQSIQDNAVDGPEGDKDTTDTQ